MFKYLSICIVLLSVIFTSCEEKAQEEDLSKKLYEQTSEFTDSRDNQTYKTVDVKVVIDKTEITMTWMAENLAYLPSVQSNEDYDPTLSGINRENAITKTASRYFVYKNYGRNVDAAKESSYFKKYGVLYNWFAATQGALVRNQSPSGVKGICPDGWHLPSDAEWAALIRKLGNSSGYRAKSTSGWADSGSGNNTGGIELMPGGMLLPLIYEFDQNTQDDGIDYLITKGQYFGEANHGGWWTSTSTEGEDVARNLQFNAMSYTVSNTLNVLMRNNVDQGSGLSVRCVKDY